MVASFVVPILAISSLAPHGGVFFFVCVSLLTVVYTLISWHSNRIPILTFNQRYDFDIVEVISTTNLETGIWTSRETSLNKTLVPTYYFFTLSGELEPRLENFFDIYFFQFVRVCLT